MPRRFRSISPPWRRSAFQLPIFPFDHVDALQFGDVALPCYMRPDDQPLASSRGHLYDHIALSVSDLDGWVAKLRAEGVRFLRSPTASATRAR
jgi:hypothetical protein